MYAKRVLLAVDQLANAVIGGDEDETISARAWRQRHKPRWRIAAKVIDTLFFFDPDHCQMAYLNEQAKRGLK